ncbi:hypothetical protein SP_0491 [Streptococcus pneumoniae TIGR4]|uniref:Uncharacterized protein n=1 Tax=Streptococcus pneumoniae serotype 4 (strain ATCC BAA-334 / TIGR4) TaxID=170187 RepID=A0A0H2UNT0_STRPN|nr:hypothetical protein SP_0491 [Streptococcus pneumoniae TIGR4]
MCFVPYYKVNHCEEAFAWYQDVNLVYLVDGVKLPYSQADLGSHVFLFGSAW